MDDLEVFVMKTDKSNNYLKNKIAYEFNLKEELSNIDKVRPTG